MAWIFPINTDAAQRVIFRGDTATETAGDYNIGISTDGFIQFNIRTSTDNGEQVAGVDNAVVNHSLQVNAWTHVAATWDGRALLYINGSLVANGTATKNANNEAVSYVIESELELSSTSGILAAFEERLISVSGGSGNVSVVFSSEEMQPALFLPVVSSTISYFWPGVILFLGFFFILVLGLTIYNW